MFENQREHLFRSRFITTQVFRHAEYIHVFHRENDRDFAVPASVATNYHVVFSSRIVCDSDKNYTLDISADDYYKLYINGRYVCEGVKQAPCEIYHYNHVDITDYIVSGENVICVRAYYHGSISRAYQSGDNLFGIIADLFEDGRYLCGTNERWRYYELEGISGHALGYHTAFTEDIDFTKQPKGYLVFSDQINWQSVCVAEKDIHRFVSPAVPVVDTYPVYPQISASGNRIFADLQKEYVGSISMKVKGNRGSKMTVRYAESVKEDQSLHFDMPSDMLYEETFVLSGEEDEIEPFDYKGFRYIEVLSEAGTEIKALSVIARNRKFENKTTYIGSNKKAEEIYRLCVQTLMVGCQEYLVDCPTREKGGYLGDFTVSGLAYLYLTGDAEFYKETLSDFGNSRFIDSGLMAVYPGSFMQEIADYSLQYPLQVYHYYRYTKDVGAVKEFLPVCEGMLRHFERFRRADGLLAGVSDKWNLVDWPQDARDGYDFDLPNPPQSTGCHAVINAHYVGAVRTTNAMRAIAGFPVDSERENELIKAFQREFFDADAGLYKDTNASKHHSLHANTLPLFYGFEENGSADRIAALIEKKGLVCGTWFSYFVLKALAAANRTELERKLVLNETEHGWINMLREGATTAFEVWGKKQKWNTSLCHPWSTAPIIAMFEDFGEIVYQQENPRKG